MGCRLPGGGGTILSGAMPLTHRYFGNPALTFAGRLFFGSPINDFYCGLRGFTKAAYHKMGLRTTGMEFACEMVIKATVLNMRLTEVPITLSQDGRSRPPHLRTWRDGWRTIRFMLMYSPGWLFLLPGMALLALGSVIFLALMRGPVTLGDVTFDANTLLVSAMFILLGFQLAIFYVFIKTFCVTEGLLPEDRFLSRLFSFANLEMGILVGLVIFITGTGFLIASVANWSASGFGDLIYPVSLRKVIPAVTMIVLGLQTVFSSFFVSMLGLSRR